MTEAESIINKFLDGLILSSDPLNPMWNKEKHPLQSSPKWNYSDSLIIYSLLMLYDLNGDPRLLDYSIKFMNTYVKENGIIPTLNYADFDLSNFNGGKNLIKLWKLTGEERYQLAIARLWKEQLLYHPRLSSGSFWHKAICPAQIWIDGLYMVLPFMAEYGILNNLREAVDDMNRQIYDARKITRDPGTGLLYHGYDDTSTMNWADSITGLSSQFWLRSNSLFCAALADICETVPDSADCGKILDDLLVSLAEFCLDDGMLLQLPTRKELENNYPETSGTLLFAYAAMKSARLGISGGEIRNAGLRAFSTVTEKYIDNSGNVPLLRNICLECGLGGNSCRDGSAEYYLSEKVAENDAKGIAPYIMAYTEVCKNE